MSEKSNGKNKHSQTACLMKLLKWNKFPRYGNNLSYKNSQVEQIPSMRRQLASQSHSSGTVSPDRDSLSEKFNSIVLFV